MKKKLLFKKKTYKECFSTVVINHHNGTIFSLSEPAVSK